MQPLCYAAPHIKHTLFNRFTSNHLQDTDPAVFVELDPGAIFFTLSFQVSTLSINQMNQVFVKKLFQFFSFLELVQEKDFSERKKMFHLYLSKFNGTIE